MEVGGWSIVQDSDGNWVLRGRGHNWAQYGEGTWADFSFKLRVKLVRGGIHLNDRVSGCKRYFIENALYLNKTAACDHHVALVHQPAYHTRGRWYKLEIKGQGDRIEVFVNGLRKINYTDADPLLHGTIALETLPDSEVYVDNLEVWGRPTPTIDDLLAGNWTDDRVKFDLR